MSSCTSGTPELLSSVRLAGCGESFHASVVSCRLDGTEFSGWWFGDSVGGQQVWSRSVETGKGKAGRDVWSVVPPSRGWRVPWDADVVDGLLIVEVADSMAQPVSNGPSPPSKPPAAHSAPSPTRPGPLIKPKVQPPDDTQSLMAERIKLATDRVVAAEAEVEQAKVAYEEHAEIAFHASLCQPDEFAGKVEYDGIEEDEKGLYGIIDSGATASLGSADALERLMIQNIQSCGKSNIEVNLEKRPTFRFGNGQTKEFAMAAPRTKAEWIQRLNQAGMEVTAASTIQEMKVMWAEYQMNAAQNAPDLHQLLKQLHAAAKRKPKLLAFMKENEIPVDENKTIVQLLAFAEKEMASRFEPQGGDMMKYGKYPNNTYQEVANLYPSYMNWALTTYQEGECDWRLARFARWVLQGKHREAVKKPANKSKMSSASSESRSRRNSCF
eukprot:Skav214825  [mRNA]  locus=scaffold1772:60372:66852:+ [translate_table: standard]